MVDLDVSFSFFHDIHIINSCHLRLTVGISTEFESPETDQATTGDIITLILHE